MGLSDELEEWASSDAPKTLGTLTEMFGPQSFAVLFVLLMAFPALPLPTGGLSHVFEAAVMLLCLELIVGRHEVWLPRRWRERELQALARPQVRDALLRRIRWFERWSRPRWSGLLRWRGAQVAFGCVTFVLTLTAFLAPPFSGLDTLPSMGVVVLSLGVLLGDAVIAALGVAIGSAGVLVVVGLGRAVAELF
jgi:hypothetical protein